MYVYIYICVCIYIYMYIYIYIYMYIYIAHRPSIKGTKLLFIVIKAIIIIIHTYIHEYNIIHEPVQCNVHIYVHVHVYTSWVYTRTQTYFMRKHIICMHVPYICAHTSAEWEDMLTMLETPGFDVIWPCIHAHIYRSIYIYVYMCVYVYI